MHLSRNGIQTLAQDVNLLPQFLLSAFIRAGALEDRGDRRGPRPGWLVLEPCGDGLTIVRILGEKSAPVGRPQRRRRVMRDTAMSSRWATLDPRARPAPAERPVMR